MDTTAHTHRLGRGRRTPLLVNRIIAAQALLAAAIPLAFLLHSKEFAVSALLGGLICFIANLCFARALFRPRKLSMKMIAGAAVFAEVSKLVLTVGLFIATFVLFRDVNVLVLLLSYFIVHTGNWLVPVWADRRQVRHGD